MSSEIVVCPSCGKKNRVPASASGKPRCASCGSDLPWIAEADDSTFGEVVTASLTPVLLDLWAPWCGPCRQVSPVLERLASTFAGRMKLVKVNVDESPRTSMRFDVKSIPTLMVMQGERVLARQI
ncbi:MAG TPA: thioredoxin domain-containing protein, partial [Actinomycetota bacterium]|nr:thioredoxin domain-containing protein [Actinomycetota bacterium]